MKLKNRITLDDSSEFNVMIRKTCKQSKNNNPNWDEKINLPETTRTKNSGVICFMDRRDKLTGRYLDSKLEADGQTVSYSSIIE